MSRGESLKRHHRNAEAAMIDRALSVWTQSEWRPEDFRDPAYERWEVERAEQSAKHNREAKGAR